MKKLLDMIDSLGIHLEVTNALPTSVNGFYYQDEAYDIIVINNHVKTETEFKAVLGHELGHYFTSGFNFRSNTFIDSIHTERDEVRATRWACDYLIPNDDLMKRLCNVSEMPLQVLADYFSVSLELMKLKFYFMSLVSGEWRLSESKVLLLSAFPSVFVVECSENTQIEDALWCYEKLEMYLSQSTDNCLKIM